MQEPEKTHTAATEVIGKAAAKAQPEHQAGSGAAAAPLVIESQEEVNRYATIGSPFVDTAKMSVREVNVFYADKNAYFRRGEVGLENEGPTFADIFVEHKDVFGLTVKATAGNLLGGDGFFERTVWDGTRDVDPILFVENRKGRIGPIFRFSVSGNF